MKTLNIIPLIALVLMSCGKNATEPGESTNNQLSEKEQMLIISSELSSDDGGVMADINMASDIANGKGGTASKVAGYDTTITKSWITYSLQLKFYNKQGNELPYYIPAITERILYNGQLTGDYAPPTGIQEIHLNKNSSLDIDDITSGIITINGTSNNQSSYKYKGARNALQVQVENHCTITDVTVDLRAENYIPTSGSLECSISGTYVREGVEQNEVAFSFSFKVEFNGNSVVTVTLNDGRTFTINLETGKLS